MFTNLEEFIFNVDCLNSSGQKKSEYGILIDEVETARSKYGKQLIDGMGVRIMGSGTFHFLLIGFLCRKKQNPRRHLFEVYPFL